MKIKQYFLYSVFIGAAALFALSVFALQEQIKWDKDGSEMVLVAAGEFTMGSSRHPAEEPPHKVTLKDFYIDKYELTNDKYLAFCKATKRNLPVQLMDGVVPEGLSNHPVNNVTWDDAKAYCEWTGRRLPTEAEWEKAARGTDGRSYPWGSGWDQNLSNNRTNPKQTTMPVGSFPGGKSPCGALDMAGNVWEWTADWYKNYDGAKAIFDETGKRRVTRGGAFFYSIDLLRTSNRYPLNPEDADDHGGFRCAMDAPGK